MCHRHRHSLSERLAGKGICGRRTGLCRTGIGRRSSLCRWCWRGRDTHNLLRAARSISEAGICEDTALLGWSQGGGAVLFAGEIGATYAPDNKIKTIVALAPGSRGLRPVESDFSR
ncbi:hypothetical protein HED49_20060 [Ochrobactrum daejeonense]|nr:hypothetical protein [Brucella daejeonensis]